LRISDFGLRIGLIVAFVTTTSSFAAGEARPQRPAAKNEATYRAVLEAARDPNRDIRARVAWILGVLGRKDGLPTLRRLATEDPVPAVRAGALRAMAKILPTGSDVEVALTVPEEDADLRWAALEAAATLRFEQRDALVRAALDGTSLSERESAVRALALDAPRKSRPALLSALKGEHAPIRAAAARALGASKDPEAVSLVLEALAEKSAPDSFLVRAAACDAMARMKVAKGRNALRAAIADPHYLVRRSAIRAASRLGDRKAVPAVQSRATDDDYTVREVAVRALGELIDPTSPPRLAARLADDEPTVRALAEAALRKFPPNMAYKALLEYVDYRKLRETRQRAWRLLGEYAHPATVEIAFKYLRDRDAIVNTAAFHILRIHKDRRIIPRALELLKVPLMEQYLDEHQVYEAFHAAILFDLKQPIGFAKVTLQRILVPPMSETAWVPSGEMAGPAAEYLAAMDHKPAVGLLEKIHNARAVSRPTRLAVAAALEKLTGKKYPVPPAPPPAPPVMRLFLEVEEG